MKLVYQYMAIFFYFSPTSNHLYPLQVENCDSNSRLVVDEGDNGTFRLERVKASYLLEERYDPLDARDQYISRNYPNKHATLNQFWFNAGPPSATLAKHWTSIGSTPHTSILHSWITRQFNISFSPVRTCKPVSSWQKNNGKSKYNPGLSNITVISQWW